MGIKKSARGKNSAHCDYSYSIMRLQVSVCLIKSDIVLGQQGYPYKYIYDDIRHKYMSTRPFETCTNKFEYEKLHSFFLMG